MTAFLVHLIVYVAVNGLLVGIWALTNDADPAVFDGIGNGNFEGPEFVRDAGFWPIWPMMSWGVALFIHFGIVMLTMPARLAKKHKIVQRKWQEALAQHAGSHGQGGRRHNSYDRNTSGGPQPPRPSRRRTRGREWVAVMLLDVADSTRLNEVLGDEAWSRLLLRFRRIVRGQVDARRGAEVGTQGDSLLARFDSPADAVLCAVEIQRELARRRTEGGIVPHVRVGVHAGEVVADDGDVVGRVVNLAARVSGAAAPDEVLITEPVADDVADRVELEDRGLRTLRGLTQQRHLLAVVWQEKPDKARPELEVRSNGSKAPEPEPEPTPTSPA